MITFMAFSFEKKAAWGVAKTRAERALALGTQRQAPASLLALRKLMACSLLDAAIEAMTDKMRNLTCRKHAM